jgi:hypothetical protein
MDTRFWGPPGWRLLHLISVSDATQRRGGAAAVRRFFELLAYVLPCKFCRASFSDYITADPPPRGDTASERDWAHWLWRIHNCVNAKLRSQNLPTAPDPPFDSVVQVYKERLAAGCTKTEFEGWDFLFAIAENHPLSRSSRNSQPMVDAPPVDGLTDLQKNRWNLLSCARRMRYYKEFWRILPRVLPYREWERAWGARHPGLALQSRPLLLKWLWRRRCAMESSLDLLNRDEFHQVCARLAEARSGCGSRKRAKTCRSVKQGGKRRTQRKLRGARQ